MEGRRCGAADHPAYYHTRAVERDYTVRVEAEPPDQERSVRTFCVPARNCG